jgi:hypothetical protein
VEVAEGGRRHELDWRRCMMVETDYYGAAERRRQELLARVSNRVRG